MMASKYLPNYLNEFPDGLKFSETVGIGTLEQEAIKNLIDKIGELPHD